MPEVSPPPLDPAQVALLEGLLKAGFQFVTFEQFARYPGVEKAGFVALLDISEGKVRQFGSVGYHIGNGIGVLIERQRQAAFVWKNEVGGSNAGVAGDLREREERTGRAVGLRREAVKISRSDRPRNAASGA